MKFNYTQTNPGRWYEYVGVYPWQPAKYKTLGELIEAEFSDFEIDDIGEHFPVDGDISHGYEIEIIDDRRYGHKIYVSIYPFFSISDGTFKPLHGFWSVPTSVHLSKRG